MSRPTKFEHCQYVGDKRTQVVYDLDTAPAETIDELMDAGTYLSFGPDTLVEARNRGTSRTRPCLQRPQSDDAGGVAGSGLIGGARARIGDRRPQRAYLANPPVVEAVPPTLVLCHGYPSTALGAAATNRSYPELADRIANEGWRVLTFAFRGCGSSTGDFSLGGWLDDLLHAAEYARSIGDTRGVWLAGFGTGGGLCIAAAARRPEIAGVATLGAPADFKDWANHPRRLLQHAREIGAIHRDDFPPSTEQWTRQLHEIHPADDAALVAPRPMLVLHGSDDETVPTFDARVLSDAHGAAELRIIVGAAHDLRHDPRAVAILLGWLDRERHHSG